MKHSKGHLGLRANRTRVQAHLGTSRCAQGVGAGSEAQMSSAAWTQPRYEAWQMKAGTARQRLWAWTVPFPFSLNGKGKQKKTKQMPQLCRELPLTRNLNLAKF